MLFDRDEQEETFAKPDRLRAALLEFGTRFSGALKSYRDQGLASAIRALYESYGISVLDIKHSNNRYDACAQFIANHEIAHAYVGQLASTVRQLKAEEYKAFEFVVDLVATQWMYRQLIINTPDSTEYRDFRGTSDHAESILLNGYRMAESQILILLLFAIGSALTNNGRVSLEGGLVHPHSMVRHLMQHVHFSTLMLSNWTEKVGQAQLEQLAQYSIQFMGVFADAGLLSRNDVAAIESPETIQEHETARKLIEEFGVTDLEYCKGIFGVLPVTDTAAQLSFTGTTTSVQQAHGEQRLTRPKSKNET